MTNKILKEITSPEGERKLEIFKRSNGTFGFEDLKYSTEEESWFPVGKYSVGIFENANDALKEAKSRVRWLVGVKDETI